MYGLPANQKCLRGSDVTHNDVLLLFFQEGDHHVSVFSRWEIHCHRRGESGPGFDPVQLGQGGGLCRSDLCMLSISL